MNEMKMQDFEKLVDFGSLPKTVKIFLTIFLICMGIGYLCAILNIQINEGLSYQGVVNHYRGNEELGIYPKEIGEIAQTTHTHMLSMSMMFFCLGVVFLFTKTLPQWLKKFVLVDSFAAVIIATSSFWLIRFVAAPFAVLMILSGMLLGIACFFEVTIPLYEMWISGKFFNKKNK